MAVAATYLEPGTTLYRVHSNTLRSTEFNPGHGSGGRFSFFGDPPVPVIYAAETWEAARCETLLHDLSLKGGVLQSSDYINKVESKLVLQRRLKLAKFLGTGLRRLGVEAGQLTDTHRNHYPATRQWGQAAHAAGFDGIIWMSKRCNSDRAVVLFEGRVSERDFQQDKNYHRVFATGTDLSHLIRWCIDLNVQVMLPR